MSYNAHGSDSLWFGAYNLKWWKNKNKGKAKYIQVLFLNLQYSFKNSYSWLPCSWHKLCQDGPLHGLPRPKCDAAIERMSPLLDGTSDSHRHSKHLPSWDLVSVVHCTDKSIDQGRNNLNFDRMNKMERRSAVMQVPNFMDMYCKFINKSSYKHLTDYS
jgi:hypothetical protein